MYHAPRSLAEAQTILGGSVAEPLILAGGTDVLVRAKGALREHPVLDLTRVVELQRVAAQGDTLVLGAAVTYARCLADPVIRASAPLLGQVAERFASPAIRNVATLGGNVANASPAADGTAALWALDVLVDAWAPTGAMRLPVDVLVVGPGRLGLPAGSLVTAFRVPVAARGEGCAFRKLVNRAHPEHPMAISVVSVAVRLRLDEAGRVALVRVVLGAVAPTPVRASAAVATLAGELPTPARLEGAASLATGAARPIDDLRASAAYRRDVLPALVHSAIAQAVMRAQAAPARD